MQFRSRTLRLALSAAALTLAAMPSLAEPSGYPQRAIELVVPYQAGGGADVMARAFATAAVKHLPQSVVVVNKPGAAGVVGWMDVIKAKPDGYKVALTTVEITFLHYLGLAKFDQHELRPIAKLNADPAVVVVRGDAPYNTIEEFLAQARKPDANVRIGNAGQGSMWHLASAALAEKGNAKFNYIPFPGGAPAILALLGGHIDAVIASAPEVAPNVLAGKLKALGVMSEKRLKVFEKVPTLRERNMDLVLGTWRGLAVPKNTPDDVVNVLKVAAAKSMQEPSLREIMEKQYFTTDTYEDAATFEASMARESAAIKAIAAKIDLQN
ncbi:tripartite tricarboxylate transporter substrate binding protein [Variovorax sp. J2P1-59]|uniref:tripartite tricarboxylate transporter substrate binding protein n=1 Tax=Variovorax flavidus TaxID=3053501 RepID=UPI002576153C|nr:tripartite tricarboxylate transporter substrate binding protein [Variovorax sp. J2P1-59]MDM0078088.1 tripartite tricarboxylate transporter substrate binding protein [Variovorax sp. J2P1-59]